MDAKAFLVDLDHQLQHGNYVTPSAGKRSVGDWWRHRFDLQVQWSAGSRERQLVIWRKHLEPTLGRKEIGKVRHSVLQAIISRSGLAPATTKLLRSTLASMFRAAVKDELIANSPADGLKVPTGEMSEPRPLSDEESAALVAVCTPWEPAWITMGLSTGVRISEGLAIRLSTVDFLRLQIRIADQARTPQVGPPTLAPLKTRRTKAMRLVPLSPTLAEVLAHHVETEKRRRGDNLGELGLLFPGPDGGLWRRQAATDRFAAIVRRAGLDSDLSWHSLRDTVATNTLRDGINPTFVATMLGNTVPILVHRYAGVLPDDVDRARDSLDRLTAQAVGS